MDVRCTGDGRERVTPVPNEFCPRKRATGAERRRSFAAASAAVERRKASASRWTRGRIRLMRLHSICVYRRSASLFSFFFFPSLRATSPPKRRARRRKRSKPVHRMDCFVAVTIEIVGCLTTRAQNPLGERHAIAVILRCPRVARASKDAARRCRPSRAASRPPQGDGMGAVGAPYAAA